MSHCDTSENLDILLCCQSPMSTEMKLACVSDKSLPMQVVHSLDDMMHLMHLNKYDLLLVDINMLDMKFRNALNVSQNKKFLTNKKLSVVLLVENIIQIAPHLFDFSEFDGFICFDNLNIGIANFNRLSKNDSN